MIQGLILLVSLLGAQAGQSAEELRAEVARLIRQLDAPQLEQRDAAEAALIERGPAVLDLLPEDTPRTPDEVRYRLARIRQKLQQQASVRAADASTITLKADAMPLDAVLAAFARQSGNKIVDYRGRFGQPTPNPTLKFDFERTPFWPALDRVLDQAGLTVYPYTERGAIGVISGSGEKRIPRFGRANYSGPFRFEAVSVVARRDLLEKNGRSLTVTVEAAWEPRLRPIILLQRMTDVSAVDAAGQPLPVADPQAILEATAGGTASAVKLALAFVPPSDGARRIASLKGKLTATLPGRMETFRFRDLTAAKNVKRRIATATVTLEQVRKSSSHKAATGWSRPG